MLWPGVNYCPAQEPGAELQKLLRPKADFDVGDFMALDQGETLIKILPTRERREIALCGMLRLRAPAEMFLQSFRENMTRKSNPAILEIGSFRNPSSLDDLKTLTIDDRHDEDHRQCVVGDCRVKLSAIMIERLQKEVDWTAVDYRLQVTRLLKQMLLDYVRDYFARGDTALIRYDDKAKGIRVADEQQDLMAASSYNSLAENPNRSSKPEMGVVENAIVWSKIKFGLKPVIAINHIVIYKRPQNTGAQILIVSKQIYANHYFDSSLALTAFLTVPGPNPKSYLFYENRSRADGLEGAFGRIKRGIIEDKAVGSLKSVLQQTQLSLEARALNPDAAAAPVEVQRNSRKVGRVYILLLLLWVTACAMLLAWRAYGWKGNISRGTNY
jgi:hypothetical protein